MLKHIFGRGNRTEEFPLPERPEPQRLKTPEQLVVKWQSGECVALQPTDLLPVAVVAQALDNQWVSRGLLRHMLSSRKGVGLKDVQKERDAAARPEYIRSLINGEQLAVNRAFLYNSSAVSRDYADGAPGREAFKTLLSRGIIVPCLLAEQTPSDVPTNFGDRNTPDLTIDRRAFIDWTRVCAEVRTRCVRLSWDDATNSKRLKILSGAYENWAKTINSVVKFGDIDRYMSDLGLPGDAKASFTRRLSEVSTWVAGQSTIVRREQLYQRFVVADGTDVVEGKYDRRKPFTAELKQLFDLFYSVNLPDALGRYAITPIDSLPRTALQELATRVSEAREQGATINADALAELVRQFVFAQVQGGMYLRSMAYLTLHDVVAVRGTDEWADYIASMRDLLSNPLMLAGTGGLFQQRASAVYTNYARLAERMTQYLRPNLAENALARWTPWATLTITIGGAVLTALVAPPAAGLGAAVVFNITGNVLQQRAGVVARLAIRAAADDRAQAELETSVDFLRAQMQDATGVEDHLRSVLSGTPGFKYMPDLDKFLARDYDQNINFAEDRLELEAS